MRPQPTFRQKVFLFFFGVFLSSLILEAGLQLASFTLSALQEKRADSLSKKKDAYRILCLGESTTQGQYPPFLEVGLNQNRLNMTFSVIDAGRSATTTTAILSRAEFLLDRYHPDMVVAMIGINDGIAPHMPEEYPSSSAMTSLLRSAKTYKLTRLLLLHLTVKEKSANSIVAPPPLAQAHLNGSYPVPGNSLMTEEEFILAEAGFKKNIEHHHDDASSYYRLAEFYRQQLLFHLAESVFKKVLELNPNSDAAYQGLGICHLQLGQYTYAERNFNKALDLNPTNDATYKDRGSLYYLIGKFPEATADFKKAQELNPNNFSAYLSLGQLAAEQKRFRLAENNFIKALELNPRHVSTHIQLGRLYLMHGRYAQAEAHFNKTLKLEPGNAYPYLAIGITYRQQGQVVRSARWLNRGLMRFGPNTFKRFYRELALVNMESGQIARARQYYDKARQSDQLTARNYRALKALLDKRKIRLVSVQYPMRSVVPLMRIFAGRADDIIFVDNEGTFKDAVERDGLRAYFRDMFGGDFGHCTQKGNQLLGENIARAILSALNDPPNVQKRAK